ncbi:MAG: hypothetical protein ACYTBJ_24635 [Planctomycetota bacterium]
MRLRPARPESGAKKPDTQEFDATKCFDRIWNIVNDEFWDPNFNGVDWGDAQKRYRPKALATEDHESFAIIINQMLAELRTSHTRYYTKWEPEYYTLHSYQWKASGD